MKRLIVLATVLLVAADASRVAGQRQGGVAPEGRQGAAGVQGRQAGGGRQGGRAGAQGRGQAVGTAVIRGRVVAADTGAAVRRAQVTAQGGGPRRGTTTDVDGRFEIRDLPAGRWTLQASKAGFVTLRLGQRRSFESVPPIEVADGQRIDDADFALPRGAAIMGRVYDEFGDPMANARVQVLRYQMVRGRRQLSQTGVAATTDDTGYYRLYGLAPGQYYVGARAGGTPPAFGNQGGTYAATYFPGTINVAEAQRVLLNVGEEQTSVSFGLLPVRTARISGSVIASTGNPLSGGVVNLTTSLDSTDAGIAIGASGRVQPNGTFTLANVIPGSYTLLATSRPGRRGGDNQTEVAYTPLVVSGDVTDLVITTTRGASISGSIIAAQGSTLPSLTGTRVQVQPLRPGMGVAQQTAQVAATGGFTISGLIGPMILRAEPVPQGWMVERIEVAGTDVTDRPLELKGTERLSARVVLTNQIPEVTGTVVARRESASGYNVIVFPDEPALWEFPSRHVRSVRTRDASFTVRALPPHDRYLAVAVDYLEDGEATDPEFLQGIRASATSFGLGAGETRTLELKLVER